MAPKAGTVISQSATPANEVNALLDVIGGSIFNEAAALAAAREVHEAFHMLPGVQQVDVRFVEDRISVTMPNGYSKTVRMQLAA